MRSVWCASLLAFGVLAVSTSAASANVGAAFKSPSGNIHCFTATDEFANRSFFCAVFSTARPACPHGVRAKWANVDSRRAAAVRCMSAATAAHLRSGSAGGRQPTLRYGRTARFFEGRVTCTSRETGVRCDLRSGSSLRMNKSRVVSSSGR
ncbi:DUF6636 domain-containing protein [Miltoncostaea oceani]|uniref:DUF6636 domain-containing protein n=1 Tax=Miltoncostaea oceani TaxID=2843216 RepID=UPI003CCEC0BB